MWCLELLKRLKKSNKIKNRFINEINYDQMLEIIKNNYTVIIDVRSKNEYNEGHINGAINIPLSKINSVIKIANKNDIIIVYCKLGIRSKKAVDILNKMGYNNVFSLKNGIEEIW